MMGDVQLPEKTCGVDDPKTLSRDVVRWRSKAPKQYRYVNNSALWYHVPAVCHKVKNYIQV